MAAKYKDIVAQNPDAFTERRIYTDPDILREELEKIFQHTWLFVAHENEIPNPGDFRRVQVANQPLLMVRTSAGKVQVLFNSCRHRASIVEPEACGSRERFECPYHGFRYDLSGKLIHVPLRDGYGDWMTDEDFSLIAPAQQDSLNGMIFICFDKDAPSLQEYLGEAWDLLQYATKADDGPMAVIDSYDYDIEANWKLLIDNTMDGYHVPYVHSGPLGPRDDADSSSMTGFGRKLGIHGMLEWTDTRPLVTRTTNRYMAMFPNVMVNYNSSGDMTGIRKVEPVAANKMRVTMYLLGPASSDEETNRKRAKKFGVTWGPGGLFGADDAKQLQWVQEGMNAKCDAPVMAARSIRMGDDGDYEGEQPLRGFRQAWHDYMGQ